jgi:pyruvate formate lyase activating enzyme
MIFGGLQKQSLIDYPGQLACILFTSGCNFMCPYCHNPDLVGKPGSRGPILALDDVYGFLLKRREFLEGVVISGGEPTLHPDLDAVCQNIQRMGYKIKLDTNGSHPGVLNRLIRNKLVDYIAMDVKTDPATYPRQIAPQDCSESIMQSIASIMACGLPYEFRTTCAPPFVDESILEKIVRCIKGARCYALQPFKAEKILSPAFFKGLASPYSREDLNRFQTLAAPWVQTCIVR